VPLGGTHSSWARAVASPPHLLVYTLVSALLWGIWALTGAAFPWPLIVMGWGVGVVMNAYEVYGRAPIREEDIQREIERLRDA
jgi:4-hydroxybenzoate polyprenyltransferase